MKSKREIIQELRKFERQRDEHMVDFINEFEKGKFNQELWLDILGEKMVVNILNWILEEGKLENTKYLKPKKMFDIKGMINKFKKNIPEPEYPDEDYDIEARVF